MRLTKIICTLGPATKTKEQIEALIRAGMNVARINMSHGSLDEYRATIKIIQEINDRIRSEKSSLAPVGILLDTKGAEVRTSVVETPLQIAKGEEVVFSSKPVTNESRQVVIVNHDNFAQDVVSAEHILIDNGKMFFDLVKVEKDGRVVARALEAGKIGSRRHVNLPGANLDMPSLTKEDWEGIEFGVTEGVDFLGLSFVREASEVQEVRDFVIKKKGATALIAKIETRQGVANAKAILDASDALMVARGDLGAEVPFERLPVIQDELVRISREAGKPVIVATHMLESMNEQPMPTRAEVTDIAHAATTGTDVTMLSGETASGLYPLDSLKAMDRVLRETEKHLAETYHIPNDTTQNSIQAEGQAAVSLALSTKAKALIVITRSGRTARAVAKFRPSVPMLAFTCDEDVARKLQLSYGVFPFVIPFDKDPEDTVRKAFEEVQQRKILEKGDTIVLVSDAKADGSQVSTIQIRNIE